jgi:hypothetical protein
MDWVWRRHRVVPGCSVGRNAPNSARPSSVAATAEGGRGRRYTLKFFKPSIEFPAHPSIVRFDLEHR